MLYNRVGMPQLLTKALQFGYDLPLLNSTPVRIHTGVHTSTGVQYQHQRAAAGGQPAALSRRSRGQGRAAGRQRSVDGVARHQRAGPGCRHVHVCAHVPLWRPCLIPGVCTHPVVCHMCGHTCVHTCRQTWGYLLKLTQGPLLTPGGTMKHSHVMASRVRQHHAPPRKGSGNIARCMNAQMRTLLPVACLRVRNVNGSSWQSNLPHFRLLVALVGQPDIRAMSYSPWACGFSPWACGFRYLPFLLFAL